MKTLLLIFILSLPAFACPQVVTVLSGRVMRGTHGLSAVVTVTGDDFESVAKTNPFGFYALNITGCSDAYTVNAVSKGYTFEPQVFQLQGGEPVTLDFIVE